jgi:hypothetical protein
MAQELSRRIASAFCSGTDIITSPDDAGLGQFTEAMDANELGSL